MFKFDAVKNKSNTANTNHSANSDSHSTHSADQHEEHEKHGAHGGVMHTVGDVLHSVAGAGTVAHMRGIHLKGPLQYVAPLAELGAEIIHHPSSHVVEKIVCGTGVTIIKEVINSAIAVKAGTVAGTAASIPTTPAGGVAVGTAVALSAYHMANSITTPIGHYASRQCHNAFSGGRALWSNYNQKQNARVNLQKTRSHDSSINSFGRKSYLNIANYHSSFYQPRVNSYLSATFINSWLRTTSPYSNIYNQRASSVVDVSTAIRYGLQNEMRKASPSMFSAYLKAQSMLGNGYTISLSEFRSVAASTNLISSYNRFNPGSNLKDVANFCREIGGVAHDVGLIKDLINSEAHAKSEEYFFCFLAEQFPFDTALIKRMMHELKEAFFQQKTSPFFSLHFNNDGFLYPVIHPAYQNTFIGLIIGLLDYWMKGFLNGGIFDETFLKIWHETANCDEAYLRSQLTDLKKYCQENVQGLDYQSLRERMSQLGLKENMPQCAYKQPFMTSFRIISSQEKIERHGNILIPHPTFRVEYSIDMMPDYKSYVDDYFNEHGRFPEEYSQIKTCYELYGQEIKTKLPQLPFCKDFFKLLGMMNSFCYVYSTLQSMGKMPVVEPIVADKSYQFPKAMPPIPVRYYQTYAMPIIFDDVLKKLQLITEKAIINELFYKQFSQKRAHNISRPFIEKINQTVVNIVLENLVKFKTEQFQEINEEEISRIVKETSRFLQSIIFQIHASINNQLNMMANKMSSRINTEQIKAITLLPLPEKMTRIKAELQTHVEYIKDNWEKDEHLTKEKLLADIPVAYHEQTRELFKNNEDTIQKTLLELIETRKKKCADEIAAFPNKINATATEQIATSITDLNRQKTEIVAKKVAEMEAVLAKELAEDQQQIQNIIVQQTAVRNGQQAEINAMTQAITQIHAHQNAQINAIPVQSRAVNQAKINAFIAQNTQQIAQINASLTAARANLAKMNENLVQLNAKLTNTTVQHAANVQLNRNNIAATWHQRVEEQIAALRASVANAVQQDIATFTAAENQSRDDDIARYHVNTTKAILAAQKATAINVLMSILENDHKNIDGFSSQIKSFLETLTTNKKIGEYKVSEKYTQVLMGFTGKNLREKTGDNFEIIGGCGISLSNFQSEPVPNGEQFSAAVAMACPDEAQQTAQFSFAGQAYTVFKIPVVNAENILAEDDAHSLSEQARAVLEKLGDNDIAEVHIPYEVINAVIDESGATFFHYAASVLDSALFVKLTSFAPEQISIADRLGNLPIHAAAKSGNADVVGQLIALSNDQAEAKTNCGATPLTIAIQYGKTTVVEQLLAAGINANYRLPNGLFPLYIAIQNNFPDIALLLLDRVVDLNINEKLDSDMSALHMAIENDLLDVAASLVKKGALSNIPRKLDGFTPFHTAALKGHVQLLQVMIASGASIHMTLESQKTALHIAAENGQLQTVKFLLAQAADINAKSIDGETPLMLAIKAGHINVSLELAQTVAINTVNKHQQSASLLAIQYGMTSVSDVLIKRGENPELIDAYQSSYLYYLVRNGEYHRFLRLVESREINLNQKFNGESLVAIAAKYQHFLIVYELLEQGANYKSKHSGLSLIHYAVCADEIGYLRDWLIDNKLEDLVIKSGGNQGKSLAYFAAQSAAHQCFEKLLSPLTVTEIIKQNLLFATLESNDEKVVSMVIMRLGDANLVLDTLGNTALHLAVGQGNRPVAALLMSRGSDITIRNKEGHTPFHIAVMQENSSLLKRMFKLSRSTDWASDLWSMENVKITANVANVLAKYRLSSKVNPVSLTTVKTTYTDEDHSLLLNTNKKDYDELMLLLNDNAYDEALLLLEQNPRLLDLFKTDKGRLFQTIFANIYDYSSVVALFKKENNDDFIPFSAPDMLLQLLQNSAINPASYTGKNNILIPMIMASNDDEACYRLELFAKFFADKLPLLAQDTIAPKMRVAELALKFNRPKFFEKLDELCKNKSDTNTSAFLGLHEAVLAANYDLVKKMLQRYGADLTNLKKQTPLMLAAGQGNIRMMELLLQHGASPDKVDIWGRNALSYAIYNKFESTALFILPLLRKKNQPDAQGNTPLLTAALHGMLPVVRYFCEEFDCSQEVNKLGENALHIAARAGKVNIIEYLVQKGFAIDGIQAPANKMKKCGKRTALHLAALHGQTEALCKLLELGADPEKTDAQGYTMSEFAVLNKDTELLRTVQLLPFYHSKEHNTRLLHSAAQANNLEVLNELILDDVNLNATNELGLGALHIAAFHNQGDVVAILVQDEHLALDLTTPAGDTALHYAALQGNVRIIELLTAAKALVNTKNNAGLTPLYLACEQGHLGAVIALLKGDADFKAGDEQGITPAQIALLKGYFDIAVALVNAGDKSLEAHCIAGLPDSTIKDTLAASLVEIKTKTTIISQSGALIHHGIYCHGKKKVNINLINAEIPFAEDNFKPV